MLTGDIALTDTTIVSVPRDAMNIVVQQGSQALESFLRLELVLVHATCTTVLYVTPVTQLPIPLTGCAPGAYPTALEGDHTDNHLN